jgi:hypothetical protein
MLISHETPISFLDVSKSYNDYDYALVHLFKEHPEYYKFFEDSVKEGRHVLLDNSIFELGTAYDSDEFAYWVSRLKPTEYIVPDVLENTEETIESYAKFTEKYSVLPGKTIGVVQGKTYEEIVKCYRFMSSIADKIAISFDYSFYLNEWPDLASVQKELDWGDMIPDVLKDFKFNKWSNYALGRICLIERLYRDGIINHDKPHHLLGCSVPWEFGFQNLKCIETIDTSNPIVAAILGKRYGLLRGLDEKWSVKLVDFISSTLTSEQITDVLYNTHVFKKLCTFVS